MVVLPVTGRVGLAAALCAVALLACTELTTARLAMEDAIYMDLKDGRVVIQTVTSPCPFLLPRLSSSCLLVTGSAMCRAQRAEVR